MACSWGEIEPYYTELEGQALDQDTVERFLTRWTALSALVQEAYQRLLVATTRDTADQEVAARYTAFLESVYPASLAAEQRLKEKLLASGLTPAGFDVPLRTMREEDAIFRAENLPLLTQEERLANRFNGITGAQTVVWNGQDLPIDALQPIYGDPDRPTRERAWRLEMGRRLADRTTLNDLWGEFLVGRRQLAANAGEPDYRAYRWRQLLRFDYTPDDCRTFHDAIEEVVVPVATRLYEERRRRLGVPTLRPWDLHVDPESRPPLRPFSTDEQLQVQTAEIFRKLDPQLGAYFDTMHAEDLLDLPNRKNKAPGGYCTYFAARGRPFIFMNATGTHQDVQTLLHEGGHAFHVFEAEMQPYLQQRYPGAEFAEVASMGMELLAAPYLDERRGGFYDAADAARARREHLENGTILFWPYMAVVDAFQHWAYTHADEAADPAACDQQWQALWRRFMPGVDWSGLEQEEMTGWQRKLHIFMYPFYYVEYGLAQLGAVGVWANARRDEAAAVASYRRALALGSTVSLPRLYAAAGVRFGFDAPTLRAAVQVVEETLAELSGA